ncbi:universal stress protein [Salinibacterium sp. TMP30]|uniref:universal stress protein n=1 Tax=Salinibacterium sp. TMP30 TaxID=3138237 RepID=UPI003138E536
MTDNSSSADSAAVDAPRREDGRHGRIVVGVDGSDSSIEALRAAERTAQAFGTSLEAVTTWTYPVGAEVALLSGWSPEEDANEIIEAVAEQVFGGDRPSWFSTKVKPGLAAHALIEESIGAEMLILGSRGRGGFVGLLLGSVSTACAQHAHCPVLIVRSAS